jgi:hypothetical protein
VVHSLRGNRGSIVVIGPQPGGVDVAIVFQPLGSTHRVK